MSRPDESPSADAARAARAAARSGVVTAAALPIGDDDRGPDAATGEARIELLVELTRAAWALSGLPWPDQPRSQWPIRTRALGDDD